MPPFSFLFCFFPFPFSTELALGLQILKIFQVLRFNPCYPSPSLTIGFFTVHVYYYYYYLFGVFLSFKSHYFQVSFNLKVILYTAKITQNTVTELLQSLLCKCYVAKPGIVILLYLLYLFICCFRSQ